VIFLNGFVTEMTKEMESLRRGQMREVDGLAVILAICVTS